MMNIKRIFCIVFAFIAITFFNLDFVKADQSGIGVRIYYTNLLGETVGGSGYVLSKSEPNFTSSYSLNSSLPNFTESNATSTLNNFFSNETNMKNMISLAGLTSYDDAKTNNYTLNVEGVYGSSSTQYRYEIETTITNSETVSCAYPRCYGGRVNGYCQGGYIYACSNGKTCKIAGTVQRDAKCTFTSTSTSTRYSDWSTALTAPSLASNEKIIGSAKSQVVPSYKYTFATEVSFERFRIEQAEVCGVSSIYKDIVSIEKAVGSDYYIDKSLGNAKYCPVYCVEENTFTWPGFKPTAQMGEHFTWTVGKNDNTNILSGLTVVLNGKRNCRTNIDLNKWMSDYNDLLRKIEEEEAQLKKPMSTKCLTLPTVGSRKCGWKLISNNLVSSKGLSSSSDVRSAAYQASQIDENGKPVHNYTFAVHATKNYTIYSNQSIQCFNIPGTASMIYCDVSYRAKTYEVLCPCDWYPESSANKDETGAIGITKNRVYNSINNIRDYDQIKYACNKIAAPGHPVEINKPTSAVQTVTTRGSCIIDRPRYKDVQKTTCGCSNSAYGDAMSCSMNGGKWSCTTTTVKVEDPAQGTDTIVTSIEQEKCNGNMGEYNYSPLSECTKTCPVGYGMGGDGYCYKHDTSYLESLIQEQQTMINILRECSKISLNYELQTDMAIDYEEPTYGRTKGLVKEKIETSEKENHKVYGEEVAGGGSKIVTKRVCHLSGLIKYCDPASTTTENISSIWIKEYGKEFNVKYGYKLPAEFYRYVLIPSGKSVDSAQGSTNEFGAYQNFINVGFPNYPVHYSTPTNTYDLDVNYKNIGYNDHFTQYIKNRIDKATGIVTYDCEYDVENKKLVVEDGNDDEPEFGGIRLIYRPISLSNPFPSMQGDGRKTGLNWCENGEDSTNCSNSNELVEKYILDNRNTTESNVYNKDPMYKVVLTPALIKQVREYNNDANYDDYNLYCENGKKCQSEFIKQTFQGIFEGCGASNDFDYCDSTDGYQR